MTKLGSLPCRFWLKGGYVIQYHVEPSQFEETSIDIGGRIEQNMDIPVGNKAEHDASLWAIGENGDVLVCRLPEVFSIPNNKILLYAIG